jgi:hypothetical protein
MDLPWYHRTVRDTPKHSPPPAPAPWLATPEASTHLMPIRRRFRQPASRSVMERRCPSRRGLSGCDTPAQRPAFGWPSRVLYRKLGHSWQECLFARKHPVFPFLNTQPAILFGCGAAAPCRGRVSRTPSQSRAGVPPAIRASRSRTRHHGPAARCGRRAVCPTSWCQKTKSFLSGTLAGGLTSRPYWDGKSARRILLYH